MILAIQKIRSSKNQNKKEDTSNNNNNDNNEDDDIEMDDAPIAHAKINWQRYADENSNQCKLKEKSDDNTPQGHIIRQPFLFINSVVYRELQII